MDRLAGRYFSQRDIGTLDSFNSELVGDIIQTIVTVYKISPVETQTNIYGETDQQSGKYYFPGVNLTAIIDRGDITTEDANFGPDRDQTSVFSFREKMLQLVNFYPQTGDIILFNERYYEIDNIVQEQFRGGVSDKSLSIICNTHYAKFSKINILPRQN